MLKRNMVFVILVMLTVFFQSCDSDDGINCPEGYEERGGECFKIDSEPDTDFVDQDMDTQADSDTSDNDIVDLDNTPDSDLEPYTGTCISVYSNEKLTINVAHKTLSVTSISATNDSTISLNGDIWLSNKATASTFKLSSASTITSQTYSIPEGTYAVIYKDETEGISLILENEIDLTSDKTTTLSIPLFKFAGNVTKNGVAFPSTITDAEITITNDNFSKKIPYTSFDAFEIIVPEGTFSMEFSGKLSSTQPDFYGSIGTYEIDENNIPTNINITTKTMSGTFNNAATGVTVNQGYVLLSSGITNAQILDLSSTSTYNVELITNDDPIYYVVYTDNNTNPGDMVSSFQTLTFWNTADNIDPSYIPAEMIPLNLNTVTMNGETFPDFTCSSADCTRGTIKIKSENNDSFTVAELGKTGAFTPKSTFISRVNTRSWDPDLNEGAGGFNTKNPSSFAFFFEGFLLDSDITTTATSSPFTSQLTEYTENVTRDENNEITEWLSAFPITSVDVKTFQISGNITTSFDTTSEDLLYASEIIVGSGSSKTYRPRTVVGKVIKDGAYSITLPALSYNSTTENPLYDVFYTGKSFLATTDDFKKTLITSISPTTPALDSKNISVKGKDITLEVKINGKTLKSFIEDTDYIDSASVLVSDSNDASTYELPINFNGSEPTFDMGGLTSWKVHLKFLMKDESSSLIVPIQTVTNTSLPLIKNISITKFFFNITIDNNIMSDQSESRGTFMFRNKILESSDNPSSTSYLRTESNTTLPYIGNEYVTVISLSDSEYKDIKPRLTLGEGFPAKHEIMTNCIYVGK